MTTKEFVNKYKKVYTSLINDPDIKETENKTREEVASEEAQQRVKQSINNEKALSMAAELSSVEKFTNFVTKQDVDLDDIIYGTPSRSHLKRMKKPVELFDLKLEDLNIKEPHPNSSKEVIQELRTLQDQTKNVDDDLKEIIDRQDEDVIADFITYCDKNNLDYDKDFLDEVIKETAVYINHLKYKFNRPRPRQLGELVNIPIIQQKGKASNTPSYPSGHAIQARIIALFLGREHPKHREELLKLAEEIGVNRIRGGFHYTSDHEAGRLVANDLWANLLNKIRSMKKAFGSDPISELIKDYMEDRKKKWSNVTKIGNFVTEQSLQKAPPKSYKLYNPDDPAFELMETKFPETESLEIYKKNLNKTKDERLEALNKGEEAIKSSQKKLKEHNSKLQTYPKERENSYKKLEKDLVKGLETNKAQYKKDLTELNKLHKDEIKSEEEILKPLKEAFEKAKGLKRITTKKDYQKAVKKEEKRQQEALQAIADVKQSREAEFLASEKSIPLVLKEHKKVTKDNLTATEKIIKNTESTLSTLTKKHSKSKKVLEKTIQKLDKDLKETESKVKAGKTYKNEQEAIKALSEEDRKALGPLLGILEDQSKLHESIKDDTDEITEITSDADKEFEEMRAEENRIKEENQEKQKKVEEAISGEEPQEEDKAKEIADRKKTKTEAEESAAQAQEEESDEDVQAKLDEAEKKRKAVKAKADADAKAKVDAEAEEPKAEAEEPVVEKPKVEKPKVKKPKVKKPKVEDTIDQEEDELVEEEEEEDLPKDEEDDLTDAEEDAIAEEEPEAEEPKVQEPTTTEQGQGRLPGFNGQEEPKGEEPKIDEKPIKTDDPIQDAINELGPRVQELYENSVDEEDREVNTLERWTNHNLRRKKSADEVVHHVTESNKKHREKRATAEAKAKTQQEKEADADKAAKEKEEAKKAEVEQKETEGAEKQKQETISSYTERISNIGASERIEEVFGKPLEEMTQAELNLAGSEVESAEKDFKRKRDQELHDRFLPPTKSHEDLSPSNEREDKDKADLKALKDAIGEDKRSDIYNDTKKMKVLLESELTKYMALHTKYGDQANPKSKTYDKAFAEKLEEVGNSIEILTREGERLGERSLKRKALSGLRGTPVKGNWLPKDRQFAIGREFLEIAQKHRKDDNGTTINVKDLNAEIDNKVKEQDYGAELPSYESKIPETKKGDINLVGKTKRSEITGAPQIYVPGKGEGWTNIGEKKKGVWQTIPAKEMEARQKIDAWAKENGIELSKPKKVDTKPTPKGEGNTAAERIKNVLDNPKVSAVARFAAAFGPAARVPEEKNE